MLASSFIRAVEIWSPTPGAFLLEQSATSYANDPTLQPLTWRQSLGYGQGLPGAAWELRRPVVAPTAGSRFERGSAAHLVGIKMGLAYPIFSGDALTAVVLLLCGTSGEHPGALGVWDPHPQADLKLSDGTSYGFESLSNHWHEGWLDREDTSLNRTHQRQLPHISRADSGQTLGMLGVTASMALPFDTDAQRTSVVGLMTGSPRGLARRVECWRRTPGGLIFDHGLSDTHAALEADCDDAPGPQSHQFHAALEAGIPSLLPVRASISAGSKNPTQSDSHQLIMPIPTKKEIAGVVSLWV